MKSKLKKIITDKNLYIFFIIILMFFGLFSKLEFATDTYCVFTTPTKQYCEHFLYSGRPISAMFLAVTRLLGFSGKAIYTTSYIIAIINIVFSIYILYNVLNREIKNDIISKIISLLIVINLFSIELFLFLEKGILASSILFCILAFKFFSKYIQDRQNKNILMTFIFMLLANFSYQGTVGIFVALSCIYMVIHFKNIKEFIKCNILAALCYGIPALINYLIVKCIFNNTRVSNEFNIAKSVQLILKNTSQMLISSFGIIPKYVFLVVTIFMIVILILSIIISKDKKLNKCFKVLFAVYFILATYVVTVFPQILQSTSSIGFAPRNTYTFASIIGIILIFIFWVQANNQNKILLNIAISVSIIYLIIQYVGFLDIERNRYILNYNDYYNALQIQEKVSNYEKETGNKITKVAFYKENNSSGSYPGLWVSGDINIKATATDWSKLDYLKYYLDRKLEETNENTEIYNLYFKDRNWKIFDIEQIVLIEDTLHFCIY